MTDKKLQAFKVEQRLKTLDLFKRWNVSETEGRRLLGDMDAEDYARFCNDDMRAISDELTQRLVYLVLIDTWLLSIFNEPQRRYRWIRAPNSTYSGKSAMDVMISGGLDGIKRVEEFLRAEVYC